MTVLMFTPLVDDAYLDAIYFRSKSFDDDFKLRLLVACIASSNIETSSELECSISSRGSEVERRIVEDFHLPSHPAFCSSFIQQHWLFQFQTTRVEIPRWLLALSISLRHLHSEYKSVLNFSSTKFNCLETCSGNYECGFPPLPFNTTNTLS